MTKWTIEKVTDYCFCDGCRQTTDPIFEVAFRQHGTATPQWNYLCTVCTEKLTGEGACENAVRHAEVTREERRAKCAETLRPFRFSSRDTSRDGAAS